MLRVMHRLIAGVLALVVLGTVTAGVVSYWRGLPDDALWIPMLTAEKQVQAAMVRGTLHVVYSCPTTQPVGNMKSEKHFGPFYVKQVTFGMSEANGAGVPFWSIAALAVIYPSAALAVGPLRRRRRRKRNQCVQCGYNLRGLTERRCPECGRAF